MAATFERTYTLRTQNRVPHALAMVCVVVGLFVLIPAWMREGEHPFTALDGAALVLTLLGAAVVLRPPTREVTTRVAVDGEGIAVGDVRVRHADVPEITVFVDDEGAPCDVTVRRIDGDDLTLRQVPDADAEAFVRAAGHKNTARRRFYRGAQDAPFHGAATLPIYGLVAFVAAAFGQAFDAWGPLLVGGALALAFFGRRVSGLLLDDRGVTRVWALSLQFVPWERVGGVDPWDTLPQTRGYTAGLDLRLDDGSTVRMPLTSDRAHRPRMDALAARILREAGARRVGARDPRDAVLSRGDRDVGAWLLAVRALGVGADGEFHRADVAREALWRVFEDPARSDEHRAAAAAALTATDHDDDLARVRVMASSLPPCPARTVALAALDRDEDAVRRALEAVSPRR